MLISPYISKIFESNSLTVLFKCTHLYHHSINLKKYIEINKKITNYEHCKFHRLIGHIIGDIHKYIILRYNFNMDILRYRGDKELKLQ